MKHIVVIGGGTGVFVALTGLKKYPYSLSAIVTMADDGGSSGVLREEFGILPPGDVRRALVALSSSSQILAQLFTYRFPKEGTLKGHSLGNLFLTALEQITGDFQKGVDEAAQVLQVKGKVIPVTLTPVYLEAKLENGQIVKGETHIDIPQHDGSLRIKKLFLHPQAQINKIARQAIKEADAIVIGPGDLYTSIIPNFLVKGVKEAIKQSSAKKIYVCNTMTKYGETHNFAAQDFIREIEKYLGKGILDYVIVNTTKPRASILKKYQKEKSVPVRYNRQQLEKLKHPKVIFARLLKQGKYLRHDPDKLARAIYKLV